MVAFGVIGFLILVIIFVVMRNQSTQRELKQIRRAHKLLQSQNKYSLGIVMAMSTHLQYVF
jgi:type II secretory pathway pseudopilin PulG